MISEKSEKLHRIAANYIVGEDIEVEINGKGPQVKALKELLDVSKTLKEQLDKKENLDTVIETIELKRKLTKKFQNLSGITWRL
jgi:hypothetical protein